MAKELPIDELKATFDVNFETGELTRKDGKKAARVVDDNKSRYTLRTYFNGAEYPTSRVIMSLYLNATLPAKSAVRIRNRNSMDLRVANLYYAANGERLPIEWRSDEREWIGFCLLYTSPSPRDS